MSKIKLGLDIGTNSIGWAVLEKQAEKYDFLEKYNQDGKHLPTKGSYIFPKGVDANENSKAAERRKFRSSRRRLKRRILRKIATLKVLNEYNLCPPFKEGELNKWKNKKLYPCDNKQFIIWQRTGKKKGTKESEKLKQPYYLRHLAATQEEMMLSEEGRLQLGRVFYHLAQRRGYLSNSEEEQTEDNLELFKTEVTKLLGNTLDMGDFWEPFNVILDSRKKDKKVKTLGNKIQKKIKTETSLENLRNFIITEFSKPENLGTVRKAIDELSRKIDSTTEENKCAPTLGSYFYSIYAKIDKETELISKIRGRYTHREEHYLKEFNYICEKQKIIGTLKNKLYNAIFYQRPLKSQKGLVAKCPFEPKRKRIATSHPLFEEFRMWESLNRIRIQREGEKHLDFIDVEEKKSIIPLFSQKTDFEFNKVAKILSKGKTYCYVKKPEEIFLDGNKIEDSDAILQFNFPMDKKFSASPTIYNLKKILGEERYNQMPFLNTGYKTEKCNKRISIEDIWHCLFADSFGQKNKLQGREEFAKKHLQFDKDDTIEYFKKVKLVKGYGNLSKAAIKKIIPFLERGEIYSHAVFLANISEVLGRKLSADEQKVVSEKISNAIDTHKIEKQANAIVNNYINKVKNSKENLGDNPISKQTHKNGVISEIVGWIGKYAHNQLKEQLINICWDKFLEAALNKRFNEISYLPTETISEFIVKELAKAFPNDKIDITKLYHPSAMEIYKPADKKLGNPEIGSIKNPVFNRAMHQIKRLCNELIRKGIVDKDTEVNIEVAGEINSTSYRRALSLWQKDQENIREWAKQEIINTYPEEHRNEISISDRDIMKYIFWKEQNHRCLYTNKTICVSDFLGNNIVYDIEHTIPRSLLNDNSLANKTLANADFNRNFKKETLPAQLNCSYKGESINGENIVNNRDKNLKTYSMNNKKIPKWDMSLKDLKTEYKKYKYAAKFITDPEAHTEIMTKANYAKLKLNYLKNKYRNFEIEEITSQFTNANLVDTRIITKYARAYLSSYFKKVNVVNGKITDTLKKMWGLEEEYVPKDRSNHIHHCIDAVIVACVGRGTVNQISEAFHKYELDYFNGNSNPRYKIKAPMENFVEKLKGLHKGVFVFHKRIDRIKPLLDAIQKETSNKQGLRGKLNKQNPYAHIKKEGELIFAQRKPISKIGGDDIENIVDEGIKTRLLELANKKGWEKLIEVQETENENKNNQKKDLAHKVYTNLKKVRANRDLIIPEISIENITSNFNDARTLTKAIATETVQANIDVIKKQQYENKVDSEVTKLIRSKGIEVLLSENNGVLILPEYFDEKKQIVISKMVIKNIRIVSSKSNLKDYKKIRKIDNKPKMDYKHDYYFDKESYTNYEFRIYGNLLPDENGRNSNREYKLINNYNIVKNIFEVENRKPILKLHQDDMLLIFDKNPNEEICWNDMNDLQCRLFKVVKFDDNGNIILERHNYALGNVDQASAVVSESNLSQLSQVVLRRKASTIKAIPTKIDSLGVIDIEFSKNLIPNNHA